MPQGEIINTITGFIKDELLCDPAMALSPGFDLITSALMDSMKVIRLLAFIQDHYQIDEISHNDMILENFRNIATITNLVVRYTTLAK